MDVFVNTTSRAIVVGGNLLVPGKQCRIEHVSKLKALYPRFAEMLDKGDIAPYTKSTTAEDTKSYFEAEPEAAPDSDEKPVPRRKRV